LLVQLATEAEKGRSQDMEEESQGRLIKVPAWEVQGLPNGHHGEETDNIKADEDALGVSSKGVIVLMNSTEFLT
jgi:hypothetical protein